MKRWKRVLCLLMCLLLWQVTLAGDGSGIGNGAGAEEAAQNVRVLLRRLALTDRIDLELGQSYLAAWGGESRMLLPAGCEITVQIREKRLILFYQGAALDCGGKLTLTRETAGASGTDAAKNRGLRIAPWDGYYPGDLRLTISESQLQPVLTINVEDYLLGVVPYEMSDDFPLEALKAQAVCARTYAMSRVDGKKEYDLVDTTNDQVFRPIQNNHARTARAIRETAGLVGFSGSGLASCYYSASNGGQTELPSHVWSGAENSKCYAITDDPYDLENPESIMKKAALRKDGTGWPEALTEMLRGAVFAQPEMADYVHEADCFRVDAAEKVSLSEPRFSAPSRLMTKVEMTVTVSGRKYLPADTPEPPLTYEPDEEGEAETAVPTATPVPALRLGDFQPAGRFTLKLSLFPDMLRTLGLSIYGADNEIVTVTETEDAFVLTSGRYGHGVGMSQRGAQWMAEKYGKSFQEILEFYYPGMKLKKAPAGAAVIPTADPVLAETPGPAATPTPRPTLMPVSGDNLPEGAWIASVEGIEDNSSLNLRAEPSQAGEILMRLYKHQRLIVLEICEDPVWAHVRTDSIEGYVMISFLKKAEN